MFQSLSITPMTVMDSWSQVMGSQVCQVQAQSRSAHHPCSAPFSAESLYSSFPCTKAWECPCPWGSIGGHHTQGQCGETHTIVTLMVQPVVFPVTSVSRYHIQDSDLHLLFSYHLEIYRKPSPLGSSHSAGRATPLQKL